MSIFEFLFKYKPIIYAKGHLAFQLLGSRLWFLLFLMVAGAGAPAAGSTNGPVGGAAPAGRGRMTTSPEPGAGSCGRIWAIRF